MCHSLFTYHNFLRHANRGEVTTAAQRSIIWKDTVRSELEMSVVRKRKSVKKDDVSQAES